MNELICTLIIIIVAVTVGILAFAALQYGPVIINYIKSFIRWHKRK